MSGLNRAARGRYDAEMRAAAATPDAESRWPAVRQRDRREALGQVVRIIVAAPGSLSGRYPEGNTGRVDAGLMTPMTMPDDIARVLSE